MENIKKRCGKKKKQKNKKNLKSWLFAIKQPRSDANNHVFHQTTKF